MRIGIDLGGTKIEFIALDSAGLERVRFRRNTPVANYPETIDLGDSSGVRGAARLWDDLTDS